MIFYFRLLFARNLDDIVSLLEEYVFHGKLEKIIEVTYSYKDIGEGRLFNETLFQEYLKIPYSPKNDILSLGRKYKYKIQVQNVIIEDAIAKLSHIKALSRTESLRRGILVDALEYIKNILEISVISLDFELQKAGVDILLEEELIDIKVTKIEEKERKAFGYFIRQNSEEFSFCYNFIVTNHEGKKKNLSHGDQIRMNKYLKLIKDSRECELIETPKIQKKILKGSFLKKEFSRKQYREIFDSVCELYNLPQRTKLSNAGSIYDGDTALEIPRNESFAYFPMERLLKLLTHEIESHYINSYNGKLLLGNFRGARNLPKEEGLAMFMEKMFHGYSYENIDNIVEYFFIILAGECLNGEDFQEFMRIMVKEYNCMRSYDTAVLRAKRNYSINHIGVQHKDVVYFRGLTEILDYLKLGGEFKKLFLGKVGFHDIDNIYNIYEQYDKKEDIVFPIFISDLIYYYFINLGKNSEYIFSVTDYYLYLKKKYWFLDLDAFRIIQKIENDWGKIERILKMFDKNITKK